MFTTATAQGRRSYQEDRFVTASIEQGTLLAVFDGHGSAYCSDFLAQSFVPCFIEALAAEQTKTQDLDFTVILRDTFAMLAKETRNFDDGSTCSAVFIPKDQQDAYVAVLGDSPVVARLKSESLWVSPEHNARTNLAEQQAAISRGGCWDGHYMCVRFGGYGLQMTRAFGDADCGFFLNREPEIQKIPLGKWLLVATDGILDPGHKDLDWSALVGMIDSNVPAQDLVDWAVAVPTGDNVTAILWRFDE